jgi:Sap, sulfolipid-1-addressing protein
MGPVLGQILPFAVGVAISPVPIIAVILMLFSARARQNGPAFLVGWVVGLSAVVVIVLAVSGASGASSGPSSIVALIEAALGLLLVALSVKQWRGRPGPGEQAAMPAWMASIDSLKPGRALVLGLLLSGVNPKNLTLAIGAALAMSEAALATTETAIAVIFFVVLGSLTILVPVLYSFLGGASARATLDGWKDWLGENNTTVMAVLLFVIGMVLVGKGAGALIG